MPIPVDQYTTAVASNFVTRAYANLSGIDLFFYVSTTNELRVKQATTSNIRTLATGVKWVSLIQATSIVHLYFADLAGVIYYAPFQIQNFVTGIVRTATGINGAITLSVTYAPNSTPPAYVLVVDDGIRHILYTSASPTFGVLLGQQPIYNNRVDHAHYVSNPVAGIHPDDTSAVTINCERTTIQSGATEVGFYVVKLPGVV